MYVHIIICFTFARSWDRPSEIASLHFLEVRPLFQLPGSHPQARPQSPTLNKKKRKIRFGLQHTCRGSMAWGWPVAARRNLETPSLQPSSSSPLWPPQTWISNLDCICCNLILMHETFRDILNSEHHLGCRLHTFERRNYQQQRCRRNEKKKVRHWQ